MVHLNGCRVAAQRCIFAIEVVVLIVIRIVCFGQGDSDAAVGCFGIRIVGSDLLLFVVVLEEHLAVAVELPFSVVVRPLDVVCPVAATGCGRHEHADTAARKVAVGDRGGCTGGRKAGHGGVTDIQLLCLHLRGDPQESGEAKHKRHNRGNDLV